MEEVLFDLNELTIGDLEDLEDIVGVPFDQINMERPSMKVAKAMIYIVKRRTDPDFTLEDARDIRVSELQDSLNVRPTDPEGEDSSNISPPSSTSTPASQKKTSTT